ncbi:hypothetical protein IW262DRAFT_553072 [Armillaria fumosa]|nr:hypothetical protein IW262DRAFT_553072 [Armillaria fumosa]
MVSHLQHVSMFRCTHLPDKRDEWQERRKNILSAYSILGDQGCGCAGSVTPICAEGLEFRLIAVCRIVGAAAFLGSLAFFDSLGVEKLFSCISLICTHNCMKIYIFIIALLSWRCSYKFQDAITNISSTKKCGQKNQHVSYCERML